MLKKKEVLDLARQTVKKYLEEGKLKKVPEHLGPEFDRQAGVFVSIKKNGELRGCIGTIRPTQKNLAQEIISNAISAANHDPRFAALKKEELPQVKFTVDVLGESEKIDSKEELDPNNYGVIVEGEGHRRGVLLPNLEGIDSPEKQLQIACKKAGISLDENYTIYRFPVERYEEE